MITPPDAQIPTVYHRRIAATDRLLVAGMHLHYPGYGHVARDGDGYRFVPEPWVQQM